MSADRISRDEVQEAIFTLTRFIQDAVISMERYGSVSGVTLAQAAVARDEFHEIMNVFEVLNDALPGGING